MKISNEAVCVVKGAASISTVAYKMGVAWNDEIKKRISKTLKLSATDTFRAELWENTECVCIISPLAGGYKMLTVFHETKEAGDE